MTDKRSQEEKDRDWRRQVYEESHPEYTDHVTGTGSQGKPCPVCGRPMQIVAGIGTVCDTCGPYWPNHDYSDLSEEAWKDYRKGNEEIGL